MEGFLVVLKPYTDYPTWQPGYRGIDRTPPYSQDAAFRGFEDPLVFGKVTTEAGLIRNHSLAHGVLQVFSTILNPSDLEIIRVQEIGRGERIVDPPTDWSLIGFDIAGAEGPFYSIVGDFPGENAIQRFHKALNSSSLFSSPTVAYEYLDTYRQLELADHDLSYTCWAVFAQHRALVIKGSYDGR